MMTTLFEARFAAARLMISAAATLLLASASMAGTAWGPTEVVRFADTDISTAEGAEILYRRIEAAARNVCQARLPSERHLISITDDCIKGAVDRAVKRVESAQLETLHANTVRRLARR